MLRISDVTSIKIFKYDKIKALDVVFVLIYTDVIFCLGRERIRSLTVIQLRVNKSVVLRVRWLRRERGIRMNGR